MYVCMYVYVYVYVYVRQSRNRSFHGRVHRLLTSCFRRELVTNRIRSFFQRISTCLCGKLVPHGFSMICNSMNESFFSLSLSLSLSWNLCVVHESSALTLCPLFLCPSYYPILCFFVHFGISFSPFISPLTRRAV